MPFASFFTNNPIIGWGLLVLTVLGLIKGKEELDEARGRRDAERKAEIRARRVQTEIRKRNDAKSTQVDIARDAAPAVSHADELSDDFRSILISD